MINSGYVTWGSRPKDATEGLAADRRALAERYTIDAVEARRRERLAEEVAAHRVQAAPSPTADEPAVVTDERSRKLSLRRGFRGLARRDDLPLSDHYDRLRNLGGENGQLRCGRCRREGSRGEDGWTLLLCGDDQLHAFCPNCYETEFGRTV